MNLKLLKTRQPSGHDLNAPLLLAARELLLEQSRAITRLAERLDSSFERAVDLILGCRGRLVVCGLGKSGIIGRKLAATFASTGTPAFFLHASEACHGDLGMVTEEDAVLLISNSGATEELLRVVPFFRDLGLPMIAMLGRTTASLAQCVDVVLDVSVERESCPLNLAPTTSTLAALAMGDALAVTLIRERDFRPGDFARFHPGGALGRLLTTRVRDAMRSSDLPFVRPTATVSECLLRMTEGRCGLAIVVDEQARLLGILTDGDLRRGLQKSPKLLQSYVSEVMTATPITIEQDTLLADAEQQMLAHRVKALLVVDGTGKVTGVVEIFAK